MNKLKRLFYEMLITFDPDWNLMYTNAKCKKCFWMELGLEVAHEAHC